MARRSDARKQAIAALREAGRQAYLAGKPIESNPFHATNAARWNEGWREAQQEAERKRNAPPA